MKYFLHRGKRIYLSKVIENFEGSKAMVLDLNGKSYLIEDEQILEDKSYKFYYIKCKTFLVINTPLRLKARKVLKHKAQKIQPRQLPNRHLFP